jgi:hypothetical protein
MDDSYNLIMSDSDSFVLRLKEYVMEELGTYQPHTNLHTLFNSTGVALATFK